MKTLVVFIGFFVIASCKTIQTYPPPPEFRLVEDLSSSEPSFLNIQTQVSLKPYLDEAEKSLEYKFWGSEKTCQGVSYNYGFERSPIDFKLSDDEVSYTIDGKFNLYLSYCPGCHELFGDEQCIIPRITASCGVNEPKRKVQLSYTSKVAINRSFSLQSQTKLNYFKIIDPCQITVFKYDATPTIEKEVKTVLKQFEKDIDKELSSAPINATLKDVWLSLQEPISLAPYGYFYLRPNALSVFDLKLIDKGKKAVFQTQVTAQPIFSTNNLALNTLSLPENVKPIDSQNSSVINLKTVASYDSINQFLLRDFDTQQIQISSRRFISIDRVSLLGPQQEKLLIEVVFSGTKSGILYLLVNPYVDEQQHLKIKDLEYELFTKSVLLKSAKWILDEKIKEKIQSGVAVDLNPYLLETKEAIYQQINSEVSPGAHLEGHINELNIQHLTIASGSLVVGLQLKGVMKLNIE